ncbi:MAG: hypothetical protein M9938_09765 [Solirubrobacterales bacterium]|nr:hypothetical protein [Solirubrobacterales bacterium]
MRGFRLFLSALAGLALLATGCGKVHENQPRPPIPAVISVSVGHRQIDVSPEVSGAPGETGPELNQNWNAPRNQADRDAPLVVRVAVANLTREDTRLTVEGPAGRTIPLTGSGSASFTMAMPTGIYRLSSPVSAGTRRFAVEGSRISSGGDVLIP